jgi:hypothetical protein
MNVLRSLWVAARQLRHVGCNPPRLILSEQLITLVVDVGECLAAMVAQQLRALDAFRLQCGGRESELARQSVVSCRS